MTTIHGTVTAYCNGCRCDDCRKASITHYKRYTVERARRGPMLVDAKPVLQAAERAEAAGISLAEVAARAGVHEAYLQPAKIRAHNGKVHRQKRDKVLRALLQLVDARQRALDDCRSTVEYILNAKPRQARRWSTEPLLAVMERKWPMEGRERGCAPPLSDWDRRYLYRSPSIDDTRAERICADLGIVPEDVWDDWFEGDDE